MWNEIKSNISSALVYFREFILFLVLVVIIIFLLIAAAGADGLLVEVHPRPAEARSDGPQALTPAMLAELAPRLRAVAGAVGRTL